MLRRFLATCIAMLCIEGGAQAAEIRLSTDFGPVRLQVNEAQRTVFGTYPKYQGRIYGELTDRGSITGLWVQPSGDHPCRTLRHGEANWGWMHFSRSQGALVRGRWGYCDGPLDNEWNGVAEDADTPSATKTLQYR